MRWGTIVGIVVSFLALGGQACADAAANLWDGGEDVVARIE